MTDPDAVTDPEVPRPTSTASFSAVPMTAWLELFYDLVFVAAILVFSSAVSHLEDGERIAWVVGVFVAVWWVWVSTTMFVNRFRLDDLPQRILVLVQMFLVVLLAVEAREGVDRDSLALSLTYAALMGTVAVMYWRVARSSGRRSFAANRFAFALASVAFFIAAAPFSGPVHATLWLAGLAITIVPAVVLSDRIGATARLDEGHIVERMGAFTIIVCGEAFVKVAIAISSAEIVHIDLVALTFQFVLTFAIWSSYFEDVPQSGIARGRFAPWVAFHLLVQLCIAGTAIGVAKLVAVGPLQHIPTDDIVEITSTLALVYVGLGLLGACTRRRPVRPLLSLRLGTAAVMMAIGVIAWQTPEINMLEGVALLAATALVHTVVAARLRARTTVVDVLAP